MYSLQKKGLYFLGLLVSFITLFADSDSQLAGNIRADHEPKEFGKVHPHQALNVPKAYHETDPEQGFVIQAAYTLWFPYQGGIVVATSNLPPAPIVDLPRGNTIIPKNPPKSGFKIAGFMQLDYDDWRPGIEYMWFYNQNGLSSRNFDINNTYKTPWTNLSTLDIPEISSSFSNQFNRIDVSLRRSLEISSYFIMTPWAAVTGAWDNQDFKINMDLQKNSSDIDIFKLRYSQYWYCAGPSAGLKVNMPIVKYISWYLASSGGVMYAKHSVDQHQEEREDATAAKITLMNLKNDWWNVEPMVHFQLGLNLHFDCKTVYYSLDAGWESQTWFSHNGFLPQKMMAGLYGDYSMQGLTLTGGIVF